MTTHDLIVSYIIDGDTVRGLKIESDGTRTETRVRLYAIDAPELDQKPFGVNARAYLRRQLRSMEVVQGLFMFQDGYGRPHAELITRSGVNLGLLLVEQGYAALWQCPSWKLDYIAAQQNAQRLKRGIWKVPGLQQTPWQWRKIRGLLV